MTTATINPTTATAQGLSTAELENELASELPEREEMSSAFRFVSNTHDYRFVRVWDDRHHRFIIERIVVVTKVVIR